LKNSEVLRTLSPTIDQGRALRTDASLLTTTLRTTALGFGMVFLELHLYESLNEWNYFLFTCS